MLSGKPSRNLARLRRADPARQAQQQVSGSTALLNLRHVQAVKKKMRSLAGFDNPLCASARRIQWAGMANVPTLYGVASEHVINRLPESHAASVSDTPRQCLMHSQVRTPAY